MTTNNSTAPITTGNATTFTPTASVVNKAGTNLGKDDFLKLMMVQLQHQDPLSPQDPSQYLSQLAQFTSVEQLTNLAQNSQNTLAASKQTAALALLGKTVGYIDKDGNPATGVVQKVTTDSGSPLLTIGDIDGIDPSQVSTVS